MAYEKRTGEWKSGGMLTPNKGNGPIMRGMFEITKEDLVKLIADMKQNGECILRFAVWEKKISSKGNEYYGLSIDKPFEKKESSGGSFFDDDPDDNSMPF